MMGHIASWYQSLDPVFAFLLVMPLVVALAGLARWCHAARAGR